MRLWIGVLLFLAGGLVALFGYAPLMSTAATSLPMILIGGFSLTAGTVMMLLASARSNDFTRP